MVKKKKVSAASRAKIKKARSTTRSLTYRSAGKSKGAKSRAAKPAPVTVVVAPVKVKIPKKYRAIHDALVRLRERITGQINFLATDNLNRTQNDTEVDFRSEEQGTDNFDRDFALNRVSLDQDIIFEIDEALNRIQMRTYGICESCGRSIEKARLVALPYSRMCVACQSKSETGQKSFRPSDIGALFPSSDKASTGASTEEE